MYPKFFFERFWEKEQRNELFVCMPFHDAFDPRFDDIIVPAAKKAGFDDALRVKGDIEGNVIMGKILDGIANSRMILIDLTDDPKSACRYSSHVNGNVLYEAGIAHAIRDPSSIVMIRDQVPSTADFDVRGLTINQPKDEKLTEGWLLSLLKSSLENHKWVESKRVKAAAELIDEFGLSFMYKFKSTHFHLGAKATNERMSILRLSELGIIRLATGKPEKPLVCAYHWTPFGHEVMKYLCVK